MAAAAGASCGIHAPCELRGGGGGARGGGWPPGAGGGRWGGCGPGCDDAAKGLYAGDDDGGLWLGGKGREKGGASGGAWGGPPLGAPGNGNPRGGALKRCRGGAVEGGGLSCGGAAGRPGGCCAWPPCMSC